MKLKYAGMEEEVIGNSFLIFEAGSRTSNNIDTQFSRIKVIPECINIPNSPYCHYWIVSIYTGEN
jgi:hypothetical protein